MKKISKSDQSIEDQKLQEKTDRERLDELLHRDYLATWPGSGCTIVYSDGTKKHATYKYSKYEIYAILDGYPGDMVHLTDINHSYWR